MNIETTRHLFWECKYIQQFWNNVSNLLREVHLEININIEVITLSIHEYTVDMKTNVKNFILIFAKHFIFKSKYSEDIPTFQKFKHYIEHYIAHNRDKLDIHDNKWRNVYNMLNLITDSYRNELLVRSLSLSLSLSTTPPSSSMLFSHLFSLV